MNIPSFASPYHTCGEQFSRNMSALGFIGPRPLAEHCGGCGRTHERENLQIVGPFEDARDVLRALGRKTGHVGGRPGEWVCASNCCRNSRENAMWHFRDKWGIGTQWTIDASDSELDAMAAAEAEYERNYASSYGLGL